MNLQSGTMTVAPAKSRNHGIDFMKFFAAILITNSHLDELYPGSFSSLATGGAIGDALFFFCSGFLLMMGRDLDFFNWYKRRVNRIFPTVFAVALISIIVFGEDPTLKHVILSGGGWFVQAILVFFAIFWFVKRFLSNRMWIAYVLDAIVFVVWFVFFWDKEVPFIAVPDTYLKWPAFFMTMLMGASVYQSEKNRSEEKKERPLMLYLGVLVALLAVFYGFQWLEGRYPSLQNVQIVILLPLMGIVWAIYKICAHPAALRLYLNKYWHGPLYLISACCLEIYLSQWWVLDVGVRLIGLFPLNVIVTFLLIFVVAYITKVVGNFLSQTFKAEDYDWRGMVKL